MKNFLRKLCDWDAPAQGVFCALIKDGAEFETMTRLPLNVQALVDNAD